MNTCHSLLSVLHADMHHANYRINNNNSSSSVYDLLSHTLIMCKCVCAYQLILFPKYLLKNQKTGDSGSRLPSVNVMNEFMYSRNAR